MKFKTIYGEHKRIQLEFHSPSLAKQSFKDECDINRILIKFQKTGLLEHVNRYAGRYEDLGDVVDYQTAMIRVLEAQEAFESLPSSLRSRFDNDPAQFLDFVSNPNNADEMVALGLATRISPASSSEERSDGRSSDKDAAETVEQ